MGVVSEAASPETAYADSPEQDNDDGVESTTYFLPGPATNLDLCQMMLKNDLNYNNFLLGFYEHLNDSLRATSSDHATIFDFIRAELQRKSCHWTGGAGYLRVENTCQWRAEVEDEFDLGYWQPVDLNWVIMGYRGGCTYKSFKRRSNKVLASLNQGQWSIVWNPSWLDYVNLVKKLYTYAGELVQSGKGKATKSLNKDKYWDIFDNLILDLLTIYGNAYNLNVTSLSDKTNNNMDNNMSKTVWIIMSTRELSAVVWGHELMYTITHCNSILQKMEEEGEGSDQKRMRLMLIILPKSLEPLKSLNNVFDPILNVILILLDATAIFIRTKALCALVQIITADPGILHSLMQGSHQADVQKAIETHLLGSSPQMSQDTSLAVHKRVIKLLRTLYSIESGNEKCIDICMKLVLCVNNEDDMVALV
ncbi:hypothetical protein K439DRAFT_1570707 [Ramaria rubella]|nr:hypothetical protein K439DRAFT_1570707 [Ramaria rubella]